MILPPEAKNKGAVVLELVKVYGDYLNEPGDAISPRQVLSGTPSVRAGWGERI